MTDPQLWLPGAAAIAGANNGGSMTGGPARVVWHTTESAPGSYDGNVSWLVGQQTAPHILWDPSTGQLGQFMPANVAARALQHPAGTPETNRAGSICIQIEVIGRAADPFTSHPMKGVGALVDWLEQFGAARRSLDSDLRLNWADWAAFDGHCGHIHVPGNTHTDPGAINWGLLLAAAEEEDMQQGRFFLSTDTKADPRLGLLSAAGPHWVRTGTERDALIKGGFVINPGSADWDKYTAAQMADLLGKFTP